MRRCPSNVWTAVMLGFVSQVAQVLLLREFLMVFHGSELSIGLILAAWMAWVGIGSGLGAVIVERQHRPHPLLAGSSAALFIVLPLTLLLIRGVRGWLHIDPAVPLTLQDMLVSCALFTAPACLLLGAHFVFVARIWRTSDGANDSSSAGKTYIAEAAGNVAGGAAFALVLVHLLNPLQTAAAVGLLLFLTVLRLYRTAADRRRWYGWLAGGWLLLICLAMIPLNQWGHELKWNQFLPEYELLQTASSRYGTIAAVKHQDQYSFFQSGQRVFSTAGPESPTPGWEAQDSITAAHLAMVQHETPARVLLIGGGLGGALAEVAKHPVKQIDYIELDRILVDTAQRYMPDAALAVLHDPRVNLLYGDGRLQVKTGSGSYDIIIVNLPDPATAVLNRYYTREFFREAHALLETDGVLVLSTTSTPQLRGTAAANRNAAIYHTLGTVFPHVLAAGDRMLYYIAGRDTASITVDASTLAERYQKRAVVTEGFSAGHFHTLLEPGQLQRINWTLQTHGRSPTAHLTGPRAQPLTPGSLAEQAEAKRDLAPVNQHYFINADFKPIGYFYTLMLWDDMVRADHRALLHRLLAIDPTWAALLALLPVVVVTGLRIAGRAKRRWAERVGIRFAILFAVFATGLSTMMLQIGLLFSFQSIYGFVYELVGLITAVFMAGLAGGAYVVHRRVRIKDRLGTLALVQLGMALAALAVALILPQAAVIRHPFLVLLLFFTLTAAAGLINGVDFPLAAACYTRLGKSPDRSAGTIYAVELFGACASAVGASVLVVPVFGIQAAFFLGAGASASALFVLLIAERWSRCLKTTIPSLNTD